MTVKQSSIRQNLLSMTSSIGVQNARKAKRKKKERAGVLAEMIVVIADADDSCMESSSAEGLGSNPIVFVSREIVPHPIVLTIPCSPPLI